MRWACWDFVFVVEVEVDSRVVIPFERLAGDVLGLSSPSPSLFNSLLKAPSTLQGLKLLKLFLRPLFIPPIPPTTPPTREGRDVNLVRDEADREFCANPGAKAVEEDEIMDDGRRVGEDDGVSELRKVGEDEIDGDRDWL